MRDKKIECYRLLKRYSDYLNKQQYSTLKGQIQAGDIDGFYKGIKLVVNRNRGWKTQEWGRHYRQYYIAQGGQKKVSRNRIPDNHRNEGDNPS